MQQAKSKRKVRRSNRVEVAQEKEQKNDEGEQQKDKGGQKKDGEQPPDIDAQNEQIVEYQPIRTYSKSKEPFKRNMQLLERKILRSNRVTDKEEKEQKNLVLLLL